MLNFVINLIPIIIVYLIFYVITIRPGRNLEMKRYDIVDALKGGEKVILTCGLIGELIERDQYIFKIKLSDGFIVEVIQSGIADVIAPDAPKAETSVKPKPVEDVKEEEKSQ